MSIDVSNNAFGLNWTVEEVNEFVAQTYSRDVILSVILNFSVAHLSERCVLIVGHDSAQGYYSADWPGMPPLAEMRKIRSALATDSKVHDNGIRIGSPEILGLENWFNDVGAEKPESLASIPIPISGRVAIALIGVPRSQADLEDLRTLGLLIGGQLEKIIKMAKTKSLPPESERIPPIPASVGLRPPLSDDSSAFPFAEAKSESSEAQLPPKHTLEVRRPRGIATTPFSEARDDSSNSEPVLEASGPHVETDSLEHGSEPGQEVGGTLQIDPNSMQTLRGGPTVDAQGDAVAPEEQKTPADPNPEPSPEAAADEAQEIPGEDFTKAPRLANHAEYSQSESDPNEAKPGDRPTLRGYRMPAQVAYVSRETADEPESTSTTSVGLPVSEPPGPEPTAEASSTMFGLPVTSPRAEKTEPPAHQSAPRNDDILVDFAADSAGQEIIEADPEIVVRSPMNVDKPSGRTLMGGIEASRQDSPSVNTTLRGGIEPILPESEPEAESSVATSQAHAGGDKAPGALILRRPKRRRNPEDPTAEAKEEKVAAKPPPLPQRSTPVALDTPIESRSAGNHTMELGREASNNTFIGMRNNKSVAAQADDWFEDFRGVNSLAAKAPSAPLNHGLSPIAPAALDLILGNQPLDIEVQEAFLLLEDRDHQTAFAAAETVASAGPAVIEGLAAMFPGPIYVDRYQHSVETLPPVGEHGPVVRALARLGDSAVSVCRQYIHDSSLEARFYALFLLTQLPAESMLSDVFDRLFDRDQQIRNIANTVALSYQSSPDFQSAIVAPLRTRVRLAQEEQHVDVGATLLTKLRDVVSVPLLIDQLGKHRDRTNKTVHKSLQVLTLHNWSSPYEWKQWWASSKDEPRHVWLVEAMDSASEQIRQLAYEELQRIPGLETSYQPEQPAKLRQREQRLVEEWFEENG